MPLKGGYEQLLVTWMLEEAQKQVICGPPHQLFSIFQLCSQSFQVDPHLHSITPGLSTPSTFSCQLSGSSPLLLKF